ncbi:FAD-dependent oxidoreductase [Corallibacter sp.]|uniref:FAD-dependent oxidoreductase n=1 Tax=Corallibacter sp. TaxID=2038084 RepID=UPI003AB7BD7B
MEEKFEVIIIGGSYAGLSAAMALGRSLRKVLIIDSGSPCNRQTPYSHNFITQDGVKPSIISSIAKKQVLEYKTVQYLNDKAIKTKKINKTYKVDTESGKTFSAQKIVFATGIKDNLSKIKGFSEC